MITTILTTLKIFSWIGLILLLCSSVNIGGKIYLNMKEGETFSWKKLFKGIGKVMLQWALGVILAIVCSVLPFINIMIAEVYGVALIGDELLSTLSAVSIIGIAVNSIITQSKKALEVIKKIN